MAALSDTPSRMFGLVCVLILVWVGVYWVYQPSGAAAPAGAASNLTTIDTRPPAVDPSAAQPATAPALTPPEYQPQTQPVAEPPPPPPVPRERVVPPKFRQIVVRQGDTSFEIIAARELGDRRKWALIARANPFVTSDRLKPGRTVLNIPLDPTNIQGKVVVDAGDGSPPAPAPAKPPEAEMQTYVVQPNDTLWEISRKVYKRGAAWRTIYEANRDVIKNPDRPPPGAVLKIPPAPPKE
jgi:nucleoid-associated protein YgaU